MNRKPHVRRLRIDLEFFEQRAEMGVGHRIEYDEPHIHCVPSALDLEVYGMGVPSEAVLRLEERDPMASTREAVRCDQPRHAAPYDSDLHERSLRIRMCVTPHSRPPR